MNQATQDTIYFLALQQTVLQDAPPVDCRLPIQVGDMVRYVGTRGRCNCDCPAAPNACGVVIKFSEEKKKFAVDLGSEGQKYFHTACLSVLETHFEASPSIIRCQEIKSQVRTVAAIPEAIEFLESERANLPPNMFVTLVLTICGVACGMSNDLGLLKSIQTYLEEAMEMNIRGELLVQLKLNKSKSEFRFGNCDKVVEILSPLVDRHFGYLPLIVSEIMRAKIVRSPREMNWKEYNKHFAIRKLAVPYLQSKNHAFQCCPSNYWDTVIEVIFCTLSVGPKKLREAEIALQKLRQTPSMNIAMRESQILFEKGHYNMALKKMNEFENTIPHMCNTAGHWQQKLKIYCFLSDKKNAKKCVKRLAKFRSDPHEIQAYKDLIAKTFDRRFKRLYADKNRAAARFLEACCNPFCEKVESYPKEFQVCGRCKIVKYCGPKCQKAHWRAGHKAQCGKNFESSLS